MATMVEPIKIRFIFLADYTINRLPIRNILDVIKKEMSGIIPNLIFIYQP